MCIYCEQDDYGGLDDMETLYLYELEQTLSEDELNPKPERRER